ncbi:MAG: hypothetical protein EA352_02365 [Gemmatimonadales bacterium]|nr:MAG: hypothetical protein EA352_02365 [Gemmatimonadales bacterium]
MDYKQFRGAALFIPLALTLAFVACSPAPTPEPDTTGATDPDPAVFVVVTQEQNMTQGMAMVLANQSLDQGAEVRVLLCGPGASLALDGEDGDLLQPREVTPGQLLDRLIGEGAQVDVCAIFLPNTEWTEEDLRDGVGVAEPPEVAEYMLRPGVRYFTF